MVVLLSPWYLGLLLRGFVLRWAHTVDHNLKTISRSYSARNLLARTMQRMSVCAEQCRWIPWRPYRNMEPARSLHMIYGDRVALVAAWRRNHPKLFLGGGTMADGRPPDVDVHHRTRQRYTVYHYLLPVVYSMPQLGREDRCVDNVRR